MFYLGFQQFVARFVGNDHKEGNYSIATFFVIISDEASDELLETDEDPDNVDHVTSSQCVKTLLKAYILYYMALKCSLFKHQNLICFI